MIRICDKSLVTDKYSGDGNEVFIGIGRARLIRTRLMQSSNFL